MLLLNNIEKSNTGVSPVTCVLTNIYLIIYVTRIYFFNDNIDNTEKIFKINLCYYHILPIKKNTSVSPVTFLFSNIKMIVCLVK